MNPLDDIPLNITIQMQEEISKYLVQLYKDNLSESNVIVVHGMMRIVHELESIGVNSLNITQALRQIGNHK